jgi:hypothetical protein
MGREMLRGRDQLAMAYSVVVICKAKESDLVFKVRGIDVDNDVL